MTAADAGVAGRRARAAALATLVGVAALATWFGLQARPAVRAYQDSAIYLEGARQLAAGQGFTTALVPLEADAPQAITAYAPGFPALIALGVLAGWDERESAGVVLVAAYVVYALLACALVLTAAGPGWWPAAGLFALALMLQPTVIQHVPSILSDLPFAVATSAAAWLALRQLEREEPPLRAALALGGLLGAATLIRWSGLHFSIVLAVALWLSLPRSLAAARRLRWLAAVALACAACVLPWLLRNRLRGGFLTGNRYFTWHDPATIAGHVLEGLLAGRGDLRALVAGTPGAGALCDALLALAGLALAAVVVRGRTWRLASVRLLSVLAAGYAGALALTAILHIVDALVAPRYWLPVWPLVGAAACAALARGELSPRLRTAVALAWGLPLVLAAALFEGHRTDLARPDVALERYFLDEKLARSAPVTYVRNKGRDCAVVSNYAVPLTLNARPRLVHALRPDADALRDFVARRPDACLVYFHRRDVYRDHPEVDPGPALEQLAREGRIRRIQRDAFGEVWIPSGR